MSVKELMDDARAEAETAANACGLDVTEDGMDRGMELTLRIYEAFGVDETTTGEQVLGYLTACVAALDDVIEKRGDRVDYKKLADHIKPILDPAIAELTNK